jgi:DNA-binding Xre family transcriptional regulator
MLTAAPGGPRADSSNYSRRTSARRLGSLGISNASLNRLDNCVQNVSLATLEKLCRRLNCDIDDLFPPEE